MVGDVILEVSDILVVRRIQHVLMVNPCADAPFLIIEVDRSRKKGGHAVYLLV